MGNTTSYCYQKAGIYNIKLTVNDSNNCKTSFTYSNVIHVLASPKADFTTDPEVITLNNAENVMIQNQTLDGTSYNWRVNGIYMGQTKDISYTFKDTGCNMIQLIAKNQNNCIDTAIKFVCVIEGFNFYMPNCISVNDDKLNEILVPKGTGWSAKNYLFEVYNRWGKRIFEHLRKQTCPQLSVAPKTFFLITLGSRRILRSWRVNAPCVKLVFSARRKALLHLRMESLPYESKAKELDGSASQGVACRRPPAQPKQCTSRFLSGGRRRAAPCLIYTWRD
jgi:hypothetical protein